MTEEQHASEPNPPLRIRAAQALALVALVSALVGALGPAERVRSTYSWPPETLPERTPERSWYTPLLLAAHRPDAINATVPCVLAGPLSGDEARSTVLATARYPERVEGLALTASDGRLEVRVGDELVTRVDLSAANRNGEECAYRIGMSPGRWRIEGTGGAYVREGELERFPVVTGLFSDVHLRAEGAPSIAVTTGVHATRTTSRQLVAWTLAAAAASASLLLVAVSSRPRRLWSAVLGLVRGARRDARAPDLMVAAVLAVWWVISPAYFDDGWVAARERMFESSRGFSHYYSPFGVNFPLDYWIDWVHHWLAQSTPSLLWNRLPAVLCLGAVWVLCRWMAARILRPTTGDEGLPLWTLATVFAVGAVAWGITLRPEPVTALFVTAVAGCMLVFLERRSTAAVALAAALVAFALSAHPAGIVSVAAIAVALPRLLRWLRPNVAAATAIVAAALALLAVLLFVGSDLEQRRSDAQVVRTYAFAESWRDELTRYSLLVQHHYGTPLRRVSVALIGLAALAFLVRRRRGPFTLLDFPAATLLAGVVLFVAIPSKWPSHFGTLLGVLALACCCEAARVRAEAARSTGWSLWPFVAVGAASGAVAWAWLERQAWNVEDLRTLDWTSPLGSVAALVPLLGLAAAMLVARRRQEPSHVAPWRAAAWIGLLVAVPVLVFTTATIVVDTERTSSWTLGRQHLSTLVGADTGCGLADDLLVPRTESARSLALAGSSAGEPVPSWMPPAPAAGLPRYVLGPSPGGTASTPWFDVTSHEGFGIFVTGVPGRSDRLRLEWGRPDGGGFRSVDEHALDVTPGPMSGDSPWRFFAAGDLPSRPTAARAVRVTLTTDIAPSGSLAVTAPATYGSERLTEGMSLPGTASLVHANLLFYFPCARLPLLSGGAVEPPEYLVTWRNDFGPFYYQATSPFLGTFDLYDLEALPTTDSENPPADVLVYRVDRRIPGAVQVPPSVTTQ